jgi:hypothetical protein
VLAPHKCAVLKIKKKKVRDESELLIEDHPVEEKTSIKDLGVIIASDLKWTKHIDYISHNARFKSYQILKSINTNIIWTAINLFTTYIRPQLEYNSQVWSPYLIEDINKIEDIQRNYTKRAFARCNLPIQDYNGRLRMLNMLSLKNRRTFLDLIFLYNLVNKAYDLNFDSFFSFKTTKYSLRSHSSQISIKLESTLDQWKYSFFIRTPKIWNQLPQNIISSDTVTSFKSVLKNHLLQRQFSNKDY